MENGDKWGVAVFEPRKLGFHVGTLWHAGTLRAFRYTKSELYVGTLREFRYTKLWEFRYTKIGTALEFSWQAGKPAPLEVGLRIVLQRGWRARRN